MDYRKEVMRRKEIEGSGDQKIILILSSLILVAVIIVGVIMIKMFYDNNGQLREENARIEDEIDYIFPDSDTRILEEADIEGLSAEEINIGKNEIYARHGRIFNKQLYKDYFNSKDWYKGTIAPENDGQIEAKLNKYENANLQFLQAAVKERAR